jgi:hypothetical protein
MTLIEVEFPDEDAVFMLELLERMPGVRIRPPATAAEAAERQRIAEFRQRLYHSYGKDPLAEEGNKA